MNVFTQSPPWEEPPIKMILSILDGQIIGCEPLDSVKLNIGGQNDERLYR